MVAGVAGGTGRGDGVRIMSCQVFVPDPQYAVGSEEYYSDVKSTSKSNEAWLYAADNGAVIASCSFGKYSTYSQSHMDAMNYFIENAGVGLNGEQTGPIRGGLVICSAGNDGLDQIRYPGGYPQCVSTGWMSPD